MCVFKSPIDFRYPSTALYPEATRSSSPPHVKEPLFAQPQSGNPNYDLRQRNKRQQNRPPSSRPRNAIQLFPIPKKPSIVLPNTQRNLEIKF